MAKSRSKTASKSASTGSGAPARRSPKSTTPGTPPSRPSLKAGVVPDDIELLNVHRYPESMPASVVAFVRNDRACQRRLEELVKIIPGKRGQSGFNQLFQQKLDESAGPPPPSGEGQYAPASGEGGDSEGGATGTVDGYTPRRTQSSAESGGIGGFFRKLLS